MGSPRAARSSRRAQAQPRTGLEGGTVPWRLRSQVGGTRRVLAAPALFAGCDVQIVRRQRRWAWGSREGKEEKEEGEVVEVEAEAEQEAAAAGRLGGAARGPEALES